MSNTTTTQRKRTKQERRKVVQVTLLPSAYQIALDKADEQDTFPGRVIEAALLKLASAKTNINQEKPQ